MEFFCIHCGQKNDYDATFCRKCGNSLKKDTLHQLNSFSEKDDQPEHTPKKKRKITIITSVVLSIITIILVSIIIHVKIHNNSQNSAAEFDSKQIYNEYLEINENALAIEEKYATDGFIQPEDISTVLDELEVLAKEYKSKDLISSYDKQSTSIYFKLNSGIGYLYTPTVEEFLAGDDVGEILTIEPNATNLEFVANYLYGGKSPDNAAKNIVEKLPDSYSFSKDNNWDSFDIEQVEQMGNHKIIIWYGHGGYVPEYGSVLGTSIPINDQSSILLYQLELSNHEMFLSKDCFCISPSYFEKHIADNSLKNSLIFLGACYSATDNRLAEVFINKGASLVVGSTKSISTRYMLYMIDDFMSALTNQYDDGTYWIAEDALAYAKSQNGEYDRNFRAYGAEVKLIYPENKSGYRLYCYNDNSVTPDISDEPSWNTSNKKQLTREKLIGEWEMTLSIDSYCNTMITNGNLDSLDALAIEMFREMFSGNDIVATVVFSDDGTFDMIPDESLSDIFDGNIEENSDYELRENSLYFLVEEGESYGFSCDFKYNYDGNTFVLGETVDGNKHPYTGATFTKIK